MESSGKSHHFSSVQYEYIFHPLYVKAISLPCKLPNVQPTPTTTLPYPFPTFSVKKSRNICLMAGADRELSILSSSLCNRSTVEPGVNEVYQDGLFQHSRSTVVRYLGRSAARLTTWPCWRGWHRRTWSGTTSWRPPWSGGGQIQPCQPEHKNW